MAHYRNPSRSVRPRRSIAVPAGDLSVGELRAYARSTDGPDTYDRAALLHHIDQHHNNNNNDDHDDDSCGEADVS